MNDIFVLKVLFKIFKRSILHVAGHEMNSKHTLFEATLDRNTYAYKYWILIYNSTLYVLLTNFS